MPQKDRVSLSILVRTDGTIEFIYSDELRSLMDLGSAETRRVSHVEPNADNQWEADMSPAIEQFDLDVAKVGGPVLGPYPTREEALTHEVKWLMENVFRSEKLVDKGSQGVLRLVIGG